MGNAEAFEEILRLAKGPDPRLSPSTSQAAHPEGAGSVVRRRFVDAARGDDRLRLGERASMEGLGVRRALTHGVQSHGVRDSSIRPTARPGISLQILPSQIRRSLTCSNMAMDYGDLANDLPDWWPYPVGAVRPKVSLEVMSTDGVTLRQR